MIWETRKSGLPIYDYYERVFHRWMRMFGPEFCVMPQGRYWSNVAFSGFIMLDSMGSQNGPVSAMRRIFDVIPSSTTANAFEKSVCTTTREDMYARVWIRGYEYRVIGRDKVRRICELFTMYVVLTAPSVITDAMSGIGKIMDRDRATE